MEKRQAAMPASFRCQQQARLDNANSAWHHSGNYFVLEASDLGAGFDRDLGLISSNGSPAPS
jgi:hypothetical protein